MNNETIKKNDARLSAEKAIKGQNAQRQLDDRLAGAGTLRTTSHLEPSRQSDSFSFLIQRKNHAA